MERLGHYRKLRQLGKRLQSRNDWHRYAHFAGTLHKVEVLLIVVEQLRHGIVGSKVLFQLEILHIHLDVGCFVVFLWIARHTESELSARILYRRSVVEESFIEPVHLLYQLCRVRVAAWRRHISAVFLGLVATQQQQVFDTEKLKVDEFILYVEGTRSAAYHVRDDGYAELVLYGGSYGYRTRSTTQAQTLILSALHLTIHILAVVGGDVDIRRVEFLKLLYRREQTLCSGALQRRQHLKREVFASVCAVQYLLDVHFSLMY